MTTDDREAFIEGLHQIADFLAEHPEVPLPNMSSYVGGRYVPSFSIYTHCVDPTNRSDSRDQRTKLADIARAMGRAEKSTDFEFAVWRRFSGVVLAAYAERNEVCERVVTGTREVTKEVPDPAALAAVPKVTVTETVEDVEWVCQPLLKPASTSLLRVPDEVA
ncbi:hypothetical protein ACQP1P_38855 [Dactylosporangium sp. CA-052675]|uniref:hypothetical protein n=1 Tax=Dactylosporangium sp. CA-052675 TaxID=3239927 RepID=UPI003D92871C